MVVVLEEESLLIANAVNGGGRQTGVLREGRPLTCAAAQCEYLKCFRSISVYLSVFVVSQCISEYL